MQVLNNNKPKQRNKRSITPDVFRQLVLNWQSTFPAVDQVKRLQGLVRALVIKCKPYAKFALGYHAR